MNTYICKTLGERRSPVVSDSDTAHGGTQPWASHPTTCKDAERAGPLKRARCCVLERRSRSRPSRPQRGSVHGTVSFLLCDPDGGHRGDLLR